MLLRVLVFAVAVVACGGPTATVSVPSGCCTTPPPAGSPASTDQPITELPPAGNELEPGRYTKSDFQPPVAFTVEDGWTTEQQTAGFFDIQDDPGSLDVVAVQFGNVTDADTAAEVAANLATRDSLSVSQPDDVKVDGVSGIRLVIEMTDPLDTQPPQFHPVIALTPGPVSIASARRLDLTLLDVDGEVLAIMVGGSIAEWDRAVELSTPVLESVAIGD